VFKYHHQKGEMCIRATDDVIVSSLWSYLHVFSLGNCSVARQCLKYKTKAHRDLYETEKLIQGAMAQMCNLSVEDITRQRGETSRRFSSSLSSFPSPSTEKLSGGAGGKKKKKKSAKS
jgi:hypothetical protein